ncbi:Arp8 chromatin-remodeling enzyme complex protein [Candida orthopsilosis Co 90-125]|uniref:Arp8 chromatin-remodeling enzyme complex protein n=1 Tax=Candida orthopsilosis (strain 90-125) TaxID=1136231 RepID=H8X228_CANO9|nr:Arp8 chromatin-remodeling enzyme complex protein [Candida orthopsilosis Co 90-125]CCG22749.1 Arp8 chromatin-remodeling enzyme complex protein [Candida orthopsilosis Co 90-125]
MSDSINPPTSPIYTESSAGTPLPSSQPDYYHDQEQEPLSKKLKRNSPETENETPSGANTGGATTPQPSSSNAQQAPKKSSAEALKRRRENRQRAAAALAQNLKNSGVGRFEQENGFGLTSVRTIPLINQKNYFTEYLKKDEQVGFIRNWRFERDLATKLKKLKQSGGSLEELKKLEETKNFDDFDLKNIENELKSKNGGVTAVADDDEEEDDEGENETEEVRQEKARIGEDVVVLQPGSAYIRIGRATDAVPRVIPNVIAVKTSQDSPEPEILPHRHADGDKVVIDDDFEQQRFTVSKDFRARMRYYKRRILPNSRETVANYNRKQEPEVIADHNDPNKKEWITPDPGRTYYTGDDALALKLEPEWKLRYPMINSNFNEYCPDYKSRQDLLGDLVHIIEDALQKMEISNLASLKIMLIIPDLYDKAYVETWCDLLLRFIGFGKIGILQEAVAATFGAGASTACIVDVGAHTTKVSCVDEGMIINDSRVSLNYGGDNITETFVKLMLENWFPYRDINVANSYDWQLAQSLKENFITFQDADIAVQLYNFYKRNPFKSTEKYEFKVFDEVMLAPMGLFFPGLFQSTNSPSLNSSTEPQNLTLKHLFLQALDQYTGKPNNPVSKSQTKLKTSLNYCDLDEQQLLMKLVEADDEGYTDGALHDVPLEKAIVESITNAALSCGDLTKMKKFYDNILIVGGGLANINGYDLILTDRLNIWRPRVLSTTSFESVIDYLKQLLNDAVNQAKQALPTSEETNQEVEIELSPDSLDLNHIDQLVNQGSILPITILPTPREFDPSMLTWKGGSVYSRLKVVNEMWINQKDWDLLGSRSLYYKSIFNY